MLLYNIIMNTTYVVCVLILFILILIGISFASLNEDNTEGYEIRTTRNLGINESNSAKTDPSMWDNVNEMQEVANALQYKVNDWHTHIDIVVNQIGCPFYGYDTTINRWDNRPYSVLRWNRRCFGWGWFRWCYSYPSRQYYDNWINNRSNISSYKIEMNEYRNLMSQFVVKNQIYNDDDLQKMLNFNKSAEQFTTKEGLENESVGQTDIITKRDGRNVVNQNIVNAVSKNNYSISPDDFPEFAKGYASEGKTIHNLETHIMIMKKFGIEDETVSERLTSHLRHDLNHNNSSLLDTDSLITNYFASYGIVSVNDFFDKSSVHSTKLVTGDFTNMVKRFGLHDLNITLFPTKDDPNGCVMEKLKSINGVTIPTTGRDSNGTFYLNNFFQSFQAYGVDGRIFFNNIYSYYKSLSIQNSFNDLNKTLHYISSLYPSDLSIAFKRMDSTLTSLNMDTFNDYINYVNVLETRVGLPPSHEIESVWSTFKSYYTNIAYSDVSNYQLDNPITSNTLNQFFNDIEQHYSENSPNRSKSQTYFKPGSGNIMSYMRLISNNKYRVSDIKRDINLGQTYSNLISYYNTNSSEAFSGMEVIHQPISYIYNQLSALFNSIFDFEQTREGLETEHNLIPPDETLLKFFGMNEYNDKLADMEEKLKNYKVNEINPSKSTWKNMLAFIHSMVRNGIVYSDLDEFIATMVGFNAIKITEWYDVMNKLSNMKINSYSNVKSFLETITKFGVRYNYNFDLFISKLEVFKARFNSGDLMPLNNFVNDMTTIKFKYDSHHGMRVVNSIIDYFSKYEFTIKMYSSPKPFAINRCNKRIPSQFPSLLVISLHNYDKSLQRYKNKLHDIRDRHDSKQFDVCDVVDAMQQVYMLCNVLQIYNETPAHISTNMPLITAFFYKEEMEKIIEDTNYYSDMNKRINMMEGVADGIDAYANQFNDSQQSVIYNKYQSISKCIRIFPALLFQYLANEFMSKCGSTTNDCLYYSYVDPKYTECKASTVKDTVNYRPNPPVL